jgi:hypothetical protein
MIPFNCLISADRSPGQYIPRLFSDWTRVPVSACLPASTFLYSRLEFGLYSLPCGLIFLLVWRFSTTSTAFYDNRNTRARDVIGMRYADLLCCRRARMSILSQRGHSYEGRRLPVGFRDRHRKDFLFVLGRSWRPTLDFS